MEPAAGWARAAAPEALVLSRMHPHSLFSREATQTAVRRLDGPADRHLALGRKNLIVLNRKDHTVHAVRRRVLPERPLGRGAPGQ